MKFSKNVSLTYLLLIALGGAFFLLAILIELDINLVREISLITYLKDNIFIVGLSLLVAGFIHSISVIIAIKAINKKRVKQKVVFFFSLFIIYIAYPFFTSIDGMLLWFVLFHISLFLLYDKIVDGFNFSDCIKKEKVRLIIFSFLFVNYFTIIPTVYAYSLGAILQISNVFEALFCTSVLIIPIVFFPKISKLYLLIWFPFLLVSSIILISYMYVFGTLISQSEFFILLETNFNEAKEFSYNYISLDLILLLTLFALVPILALNWFFKHNKEPKSLAYKYAFGLVSLFLFLSFVDDSYQFNPFYSHVSKIVRYKNQFDDFKAHLEERKKNRSSFSKITSSLPANNNQTYVMIIGESTTRNHMSIYNYQRKTNPLLESLNNELYLFKDVLSPASSTLKSLKKVLTFANTEDMAPFNEKGSLVEFFNEANFETFWISNQQFTGRWETLISVIANSSNHVTFLNDPTLISENSYDEKILKQFEIALNSNQKNKFIVLHLMGTHAKYANRYPSRFEIFKKSKGIVSKFANTEVKKTIVNDYDNAVLYNDYIVYETINMLKRKNVHSFITYFSDHGDEVYDKTDFFGHSSNMHSNQLFEIPFIIWFSDKYKTNLPDNITQVNKSLNSKYQIDDVIHTFIDLSSLNCTEFESMRSVVNPDFTPKERVLD